MKEMFSPPQIVAVSQNNFLSWAGGSMCSSIPIEDNLEVSGLSKGSGVPWGREHRTFEENNAESKLAHITTEMATGEKGGLEIIILESSASGVHWVGKITTSLHYSQLLPSVSYLS